MRMGFVHRSGLEVNRIQGEFQDSFFVRPASGVR